MVRQINWRSVWLTTMAATAVLNGVIAALLTFFDLTPGPALHNVVYSYCIGTLVTIGILAPRHLLWPRSRPSALVMFTLPVVAGAFGLVFGRMLAALLLLDQFDLASVFNDHTFRISLIVTALASFGGTAYFWRRERNALDSAQAALEREHRETVSRQLAETQLQLLRAQVDPHMLFNTLANLRALIGRDPNAAQLMLDRLIDFFRASLAASRNEWSTCEREFKLADDYLQLIAIRMGERLRFTLDLPSQLRSAKVPSMLLQPLIENAIKHGLEPARSGGEVSVSARVDGIQLELLVRDTGMGMRPIAASNSAAKGKGGFGTAQIHERLRTLFQDDASFELLPLEPSGTLARIRLPIGSPIGSPIRLPIALPIGVSTEKSTK